MVYVDEVETAAGDQRQRHVVEPEILRLRRAGRAVALGEEMAGAVVEEMRDGRGRGLGDALPEEIVRVARQRQVQVRHLHHAVAEVIGEAQRRAVAAIVGREIAGRAVAEAARGAAIRDRKELVAVGGVAVGLREIGGAAALRGAVADGVVAIGERAVDARDRDQGNITPVRAAYCPNVEVPGTKSRIAFGTGKPRSPFVLPASQRSLPVFASLDV